MTYRFEVKDFNLFIAYVKGELEFLNKLSHTNLSNEIKILKYIDKMLSNRNATKFDRDGKRVNIEIGNTTYLDISYEFVKRLYKMPESIIKPLFLNEKL